jgi:hypothetical protein
MLPMQIKVKVKPRSDRPDELSNEVGGYKPLQRVGAGAVYDPRPAAPAASKPAPPSPPPAKAGGAVPPWKKPAAA